MARVASGLLRAAWGLYALAAFGLLFVVAALLALVVPGLEPRRRLTRRFARLGLAVIGIRLSVLGLGQLPESSCVVVANHASYLDGVVMKAALPPRFSFVIKREAARLPLAGWLLRRIGSEFVDRFDRAGRQRDARRVMRRAQQGHSLVFFPEGTFTPEPGLQRFHIGAFVAAARGGVPVVPAVIHGARRLLPADSFLPRPGRIRIEILEPLPATGGAAEALRDGARRRIAAHLDEPDLLAPTAAGPAVPMSTTGREHPST